MTNLTNSMTYSKPGFLCRIHNGCLKAPYNDPNQSSFLHKHLSLKSHINSVNPPNPPFKSSSYDFACKVLKATFIYSLSGYVSRPSQLPSRFNQPEFIR